MTPTEPNIIERLTRDIKTAATVLGQGEARYLVGAYYTLQDNRIRAANQCRKLNESDEPAAVIEWFAKQQGLLETRAKQALQAYSEAHPIGRWMMEIRGIGPVISAGLLCRERVFMTANHVSQVWSYAGQSPKAVGRKRGVKLAHNPQLKRLLWLLGECMIKAQKKEDIYRQVYDARKVYEQAKNEAGDYADQAATALSEKNYRKGTGKLEAEHVALQGIKEEFPDSEDPKPVTEDEHSSVAYQWYSQGKLPPAHIHRRCCRHMTNIFLSNLFEVWKFYENGVKPARPYVQAILGHADMLAPPNMHMIVPKGRK